MYHYIEKFNPKLKYFSYLDVKNFEKQVSYFKRKYEFFDCNELFNKNFEKKNFSKKIFLTFDDGLMCHYKYAFKILKKYKINAIFYIPSSPILEKKILPVHKIHLILGKYGGEKAYDYLKSIVLEKNFLDEDKIKYFENKLYVNQKNNKKTFFFKKILNYYIDEKKKTKIVDKIFRHFFKNQETYYFDKLYMKKKHIKSLIDNNMVIGAHSHSHRVLSNLNANDYKKDILLSLKFLKSFDNKKTFSYPYGGFHTFNKKIQKFMEKKKVSFSVNVEPRDIVYNDLLYRKQALPRYDCNKFLYGKIAKV